MINYVEFCTGQSKCVVCGKVKEHGSQWAWRYKGRFTCSWTCYRELERRDEEKKHRKENTEAEEYNRAPLTPAQRAEIVILAREGTMSNNAIAKQIGCTRQAVAYITRKAGLPSHQRLLVDPALISKIQKEYLDTGSISQTAIRIGCSESTVVRYTREIRKERRNGNK